MKGTAPVCLAHGATTSGAMARRLAGLALVVFVFGAVLFAHAWVIGGEDAVSDNWVGVTVLLALFAGLLGSFAALVTAVFAGLRHEAWSRGGCRWRPSQPLWSSSASSKPSSSSDRTRIRPPTSTTCPASTAPHSSLPGASHLLALRRRSPALPVGGPQSG